MADVTIDTEFPVWALLPKRETGVSTFLNKYPEYDGRGVIIAIFDSGVDPGAPGLQKTSDGKIKVIERFDCSGCGDVNTTTVARATDGYLTGITGRKLKVPDTWNNPSGDYRLGVKCAFDLYPKRLKDRIQEERKKLWNSSHSIATAEATRSLSELEKQLDGKTNLSIAERFEKEDVEAKVEILNNFEKKYNDLGPIYDCILFHDGSKWVACVDTSEKGDLVECPLLGEYSITHEYSPLTKSDQLNFSINVHNEGNTLELVGLCSTHGTHVASIASAYFEDAPEKNGIAPGAQIVSLKIADGRLGTMETGTAIVRAMIKVMEMQKTNPVHVINMSYGEHANWSNTGRLGELMNEVVNDYGVVWVVSGSNNGPALSTIGSPPDVSQENLIGIGAYVSPEMMVAEYSMRQKLGGMTYTWSSRGPTIDGGFGISVCAPGGAITSVPNFTLQMSQLMNGTSMASPHAAGTVALLISGLLQRELQYSPYSIKRALQNSATFLENIEPFAQGHGLLQVDKAFEYLVNYHDAQERDVRFHIICAGSTSKGIYIRSKVERNSYECNIVVEPYFKDHENVEAAIKIQFNMRLAVTCRASYVNHPNHLDLSNGSRTFSVKIDAGSLLPGVHHTSIDAYDITCIAKGPVFRVPITIIRSTPLPTSDYTVSYKNVLFKPNTIKRHYFIVPEHATWAVIRMRCTNEEETGRFILHSLQLLPKRNCKTSESNKHVSVSSYIETAQSVRVHGGIVLEVVVAKYWANLGDTTINYSIEFHGIKPIQPNLTIHASDGVPSVDITTLLAEEILPTITLKSAVQILRPSDAKVHALTTRDMIPKGRQIYELVLTYNFHLNKAAEVRPICTALCDLLYESEFESQLWLLFDSNKQLLGCGDYYPSKYSVKLEKGDFVIRLQVRHEKKDHLDKLTDCSVLLQQKLAAPITMDVCCTHSQALIGEKKTPSGIKTPSSMLPLYIAMISSEKFIPKLNNAAHYLTGTVTYAKDELGKRVDAYPVKYFLNDTSKTPAKSTDKDKTKLEEYQDALQDFKTMWLSKIEDRTVSEKLYEEICAEFPDHVLAHTAYIQTLITSDTRRLLSVCDRKQVQAYNKDELEKIVSLCNKILETINEESLLVYFAIKNDRRPAATKIKITMEKQKVAFIDTLCYKGITVCRLIPLSKESEEQLVELNRELDQIWNSLLKFADPNDKGVALNVLYFAMSHANTVKNYGRLLKYILKLQEERNTKDVEERVIEVCKSIKWEYLVQYLQSSLPIKFPLEYRPF